MSRRSLDLGLPELIAPEAFVVAMIMVAFSAISRDDTAMHAAGVMLAVHALYRRVIERERR